MRSDQLALVQGWPHTRATLRRWNANPWRVLVPWSLGALLVAVGLLAATWLAAAVRLPDPTPHSYPGITRYATLQDFAFVLRRNFTVLALHSLVCVAGFLACWTPDGRRTATQRYAAPAAIVFVTAATLFSLITQASALGAATATMSAQLGVPKHTLLLALTPHALPELFAVFLPLAAWTIASRRGTFDELLAATIATTAIAIPLVVVAAAIETWVTPRLLWSLIW